MLRSLKFTMRVMNRIFEYVVVAMLAMLMAFKLTMRVVNRVCEYIVAAMLAVMTLVVFIQVCCRLLGTGLDFSEELARYLMVAIVVIGASIGVHRGGNIGIEAFAKRLPPSGRKAAAVTVDLLSLFLFEEVARYSLRVLPIVGRQKWASLNLSMGIPYAFILAGASIIFLHLLVHLLEQIFPPAPGAGGIGKTGAES